MDIGVSFEAGAPVLTLTGRFDGSAAAAFDERVASLEAGTSGCVIDMSGVVYLSSLGLRSLMSLEQRLKTRGGGVVLAGLTPLVHKVLRIARLDTFLRIVPSTRDALETVRASAAAAPAVDLAFEDCRATVRRMPGAASVIEWWGPSSTGAAGTRSTGVDARDLGIAFGLGTPGDGVGRPGVEPAPFFSTPQFAAVIDAGAGGLTDFIVGDALQVVRIAVAAATGLAGAPAAIVELASERGCSLIEIVDRLCDHAVAEDVPVAIGFVALARTTGAQPGVYAAGIVFDPLKTGATLDPGRRLEAAPAQLGLKSGRRAAGAAVTFETAPQFDAVRDVRAAAPDVSIDTLGRMVGLDECAPVTEALVWLFVPGELRNGADRLLQVSVEGGGEWRPEWDAIVRRLYGDCRSVTLTALPGGFMSSTFKAVAYDHDGRRTLPGVVKIGPVELTRREQQANRDYVSRFILNNGTSVLGDARHGDWAGLRYNFLGVNGPDSRLAWLHDQYLQRTVPDVTALFERLLTRVLKPWYAQPKWEQVYLFQEHTPLRLFPALIETAGQVLGVSADDPEFDCPELGVRLPNPFRFLKYEYPRRAREPRLWYTALCHGDLNLRNVLVDERDNLYVIDFSETRPRNAVSDFARLEPVLKFEMTRVDTDADLAALVEFEEAITSVRALDEPPPFRYRGTDPLVARAHAVITLLRRCADRATLFERDIVPYWLAVLEWTYSVVCYRQVSLRQKRYAACSAALICRAIMQIEGRA